MLAWMMRRPSLARRSLGPTAPEIPSAHAATGAYRALYDYLNRRFADTVVLTLAEIEDILGFPLPEAARVHAYWWVAPDGAPASAQQAWRLAGRTARPNPVALTVTFDRSA